MACLDLIAAGHPALNWDMSDWDASDDHEAPRGAKERLSGHMARNAIYRETQHQAGFTSELDFDRLRATYRSFRHLKFLVNWLADDTEEMVYPIL